MAIRVYYHLFCPGGTLQGSWRNLWHDQMASFEDSGLVEAGAIMHMGVICDDADRAEIESRVGQYPFITSWDYTPLSENDNWYEGATLQRLWEDCKGLEALGAPVCPVLYFHSKGAVTANKNTVAHRRMMEYFCIEKWNRGMGAVMDTYAHQDAEVPSQRGYDAAGCEWRHAGGWHFSGNFWWSNSRYITTLQNPMTDCAGFGAGYYHAGPEGGDNSRIKFEMWIGSGNPRVCELFQSGGLNWYTDSLTRHQYAKGGG